MLRKFIIGLVVSQLAVGLNAGAVCAAPSEADSIRQLRSMGLESCARGDWDAGLNSFEGAIRMAEKAYGHDSTSVAEICFEAGVSALKGDRYQKAEDCLIKAVKINPNAIEARLKLAEYYKVRGRLSDAKQHIQKVLAKHPDCAEAHGLLALTYQQEGNVSRATDECYRLHELTAGQPSAQEMVALAPPPPVIAPPVKAAAAVVIPTAAALSKPAAELQHVQKPVTKPVPPKPATPQHKAEPKKSKAELKKEKKILEMLRKAEAKAQHDAKAKHDAKTKPSKAKQPPKQAVQAASDEPQSSWGLPARLHSKAVLLTPVGKKAASASSTSIEPKETTKPKDAAKPKETPKTVEASKPAKKEPKPVDVADTRSPEAPVEDASSATPAAKPKPAPAKPVMPKMVKAELVKKGGRNVMVPPPPPVVPVFPTMSMPVVQAPPPPKPKAVEKPKPEVKDDRKPGEDDSEFLLDWAGKNKKKGK